MRASVYKTFVKCMYNSSLRLLVYMNGLVRWLSKDMICAM